MFIAEKFEVIGGERRIAALQGPTADAARIGFFPVGERQGYGPAAITILAIPVHFHGFPQDESLDY
jgi:hypothetical protein